MKVIWSYGILTIPMRVRETLPDTISSLAGAGFDQPRLFIDGAKGIQDYTEWNLPTTCRYPAVGVVANWIMSALELYYREPGAHFYALFQDDILICRNVKEYIGLNPFPDRSYINLYTVPDNENLQSEGYAGWYPSNQKGQGALGLVFTRDGLITLLTQTYVLARFRSVMGHKCIDGTIIDALSQIGWKEYVHKPSLMQHTGKLSTIKNQWRDPPKTFPGVDFDPMEIICPTNKNS